jgi:hypothetical protein
VKRLMVSLTLGLLAAPAATAPARESRYAVRETEQLQRSLSFTGQGTRRLEIDNVFGSIQIAAYDGDSVEMAVTHTLEGRTPALVEQARREVTLEVSEAGPVVRLYVDGPFRDCDCEDRDRRSWQNPGYRVVYDFALKVPREVSLTLRTVNEGWIRVGGTDGEFDVQNVNGGIEMLDVAGAGDVHTVNGPVRVLFRRNPASPSSFRTVNGDVVVLFGPALDANLRLETLNGELYSDFDTTALARLAPVGERRNGKFVYKADRAVGLRVGRGGPELRFETLNGDVCILQRERHHDDQSTRCRGPRLPA